MKQPAAAAFTLRAALYVRVSTDEQADEGHSIDAQTRVLRDFCARKGWEVVGEYVDSGFSGRSLKRPKIQALLHNANSTPRPFDVIVVHKLDRFSRSIKDTINTLTRLKELGIGFASATQPLDLTSPEGKAMLMMLALFAEIYIDNLSKETAKGMEERARKGFANGHVPFGYRSLKKKPTSDAERGLEFHPKNIEGYRLAIRMCADGKRISEIMHTLNAQGYRSLSFRGERPFSKDMLFPLLKNRFYLGEISYKGEWLPGQHPPAIDVETWERAQAQMKERAFQKSGHHTNASRPYVLRGLLHCGECGNRLRGWIARKDVRYYRCPASDKGQTCGQVKEIRAAHVEGEIGEILTRLHLPEDWLTRALALLGEGTADNARRERQRVSLEGQLQRLRIVFQLGDCSEQEYRSERDRLRRELAELRPVKHLDLERTAGVMQNFGELWTKATLAEQEDIAHAVIERIFTVGGKIVSVEPKPDFYPLLVVAAEEAGICIADDGLSPPSPISVTQVPVLVIVSPGYYRPRASESHLHEVHLSPAHAHQDRPQPAAEKSAAQTPKRSPRRRLPKNTSAARK